VERPYTLDFGLGYRMYFGEDGTQLTPPFRASACRDRPRVSLGECSVLGALGAYVGLSLATGVTCPLTVRSECL
jgi:hypothetical protein